jgi:hypothetical protein
MIKLHDVRTGDNVLVEYEGRRLEGHVINVNREDKQVQVQTGDQDFWYPLDSLYALPLDEEQLFKHKFQKDEALSDGGNTRVYVRGPFSVKLHEVNGHAATRLDYRDEHREINGPITINQLQNHYHEMTNFHLD